MRYLMHRTQEVRKYNPWNFREILTIPKKFGFKHFAEMNKIDHNSRFLRVIWKPRVYLNSGRRAGSIYMYYVETGSSPGQITKTVLVVLLLSFNWWLLKISKISRKTKNSFFPLNWVRSRRTPIFRWFGDKKFRFDFFSE